MTMMPYKCQDCGREGCKLWREYQTFLEHQHLRCYICAGKDQEVDVSDVDRHGLRRSEIGGELGVRTDQIGWLVPAIPTEENDTFWGYSAVPQNRHEWWKALPT